MEDFGGLVRQARADLAMEQRELAQSLGVSVSSIANWEHGRSRPRGAMLRDLARTLRKPLSYFTGDPASDAEPQPSLDMEAMEATLQRIVNREPDAPRGADFPGVQELLGDPVLCRQLGITEADKHLLAECYVAQVGPATVAEAVKLLDVLRQMSAHR
ncbi:MAG: helix-turn-helix transcriptional regulator [Armatimonadia bacterium]